MGFAMTEEQTMLKSSIRDFLDKGEKSRWQASLAKAYSTEGSGEDDVKGYSDSRRCGLSEEYPVERYFRYARTLTIPVRLRCRN